MKRLNLFMGATALIAVSLTASPALMAQEDENRDELGKVVRGPYETNRFGDNWFIGVSGGLNAMWKEGVKLENLRVAPSIDANLGKWFTPAIGMRLGYQGINSRMWSETATVLGPTLDSEKGMYPEKMGYMYVHGDFLFNISDALGGYKESRLWDFVPYMHAGFFRSYGLDDVDFADNELAAGAGLLHNIRLAERLDVIVDMRATVVNGRVCASEGIAVLPSVTMGFAMDLGWASFIRTSDILSDYQDVMMDEMASIEAAAVALELANAALMEKNANLEATNKKLARDIAAKTKKPAVAEGGFSVEDFFAGMTPAVVYFDIGKAVLGDKEMQHMDFIAKNILEVVDDETTIYINLVGTADDSTGSKKRNQYLSEARGKYVYDLLVEKYGISSDRLVLQSKVTSVSGNPELDRAVVITF